MGSDVEEAYDSTSGSQGDNGPLIPKTMDQVPSDAADHPVYPSETRDGTLSQVQRRVSGKRTSRIGDPNSSRSTCCGVKLPGSARAGFGVGMMVLCLVGVYVLILHGDGQNWPIYPGTTVHLRAGASAGMLCSPTATGGLMICNSGGPAGIEDAYRVLDGGGFFEGSGKIHLKSVRYDGFCSDDNALGCTKSAHKDWETFIVHRVDHAKKVALQSYKSGKFCSVKGPGVPILGDAQSVGSKETFSVDCVEGCNQAYGKELGVCQDTVGWGNGYDCKSAGKGKWDGCDGDGLGWTCAGYSDNGWCKDGLPDIQGDWLWASYPIYNDPAKHCCVCGKEEAKWMLVIGSGVAWGQGASHEYTKGWSRELGLIGEKRRIFPVNIAVAGTDSKYWRDKTEKYLEATIGMPLKHFSLVVVSLSIGNEGITTPKALQLGVTNVASDYLDNFQAFSDRLKKSMDPQARLVVAGPHADGDYTKETFVIAQKATKEMQKWSSPDYVIDFLQPTCADSESGKWLRHSAASDHAQPNDQGHKQMLECADPEKLLGPTLWAGGTLFQQSAARSRAH